MIIVIENIPYRVNEGITIESLKADIAEGPRDKLLCKFKHKWEQIGEPYAPPEDLLAALALAAAGEMDLADAMVMVLASEERRLFKCVRCGKIIRQTYRC